MIEWNTGTRGTEPCNTKKDSVPLNKVRAFFFTWNNWNTGTLEHLELWLEKECDEYHCQKEMGESGTPHIQGCFRFKSARSCKKVFSDIKSIVPELHLEVSRDWKKSVAYCSKNDTRVGDGPSNMGKKRIPDPLEGKELYEWQKEVIDILEGKPDDRTVYWYCDRSGNKGKTTLAKSIFTRSPNMLYASGKAADVKCAIASMVEKGKFPPIVIFDFVRSSESFISYEAIEAVKNGIFFNGKYESGMVVFPVPHVIVFANFMPDEDKLSKDRWQIKNI